MPTLEKDPVLLDDPGDAADRRPDQDADPRGVDLLEPGVLPCLLRRRDG